MDTYTFIATALATYYITSAITISDGPALAFAKLRHKYEFLECFICVAFWVSLAVLLVAYFAPVAIYPLAIAGGALLLDKLKKY
jgi:hypothetical protein